jgi:hypothetical protein
MQVKSSLKHRRRGAAFLSRAGNEPAEEQAPSTAMIQAEQGSDACNETQGHFLVSERYAYATLTAVTGGNPESACRNDSPLSSVIQTVPSVMPTMNTSGLSGSPAVDRGAAVIWAGSPPVSRCQVSP